MSQTDKKIHSAHNACHMTNRYTVRSSNNIFEVTCKFCLKKNASRTLDDSLIHLAHLEGKAIMHVHEIGEMARMIECTSCDKLNENKDMFVFDGLYQCRRCIRSQLGYFPMADCKCGRTHMFPSKASEYSTGFLEISSKCKCDRNLFLDAWKIEKEPDDEKKLVDAPRQELVNPQKATKDYPSNNIFMSSDINAPIVHNTDVEIMDHEDAIAAIEEYIFDKLHEEGSVQLYSLFDNWKVDQVYSVLRPLISSGDFRIARDTVVRGPCLIAVAGLEVRS